MPELYQTSVTRGYLLNSAIQAMRYRRLAGALSAKVDTTFAVRKRDKTKR